MAEVYDTTECPRVGLAEALAGARPLCRVLLAGGGEAVPNRPMLWPADIEDVNALHDPAASPALTADAFVHFIRDVQVGGYGCAVVKDGRYVYNDSAYPYYARFYIEQGLSEPFWSVAALDPLHIDYPIHVITHFNPIYGHWLLEILPKLFAIGVLMKRGLMAPILLPRAAAALLADTIALILPGCPIVEYDHERQTVHAVTVILPPMLQHNYVFNPLLRALLSDFLAPFRANPGPAAIFVSRSALQGRFRAIADPDALDHASGAMGLTIVRPETLPWTEQVRIFASARLIVGEYGSGLHNTFFSPAGARVVSLNVMGNVQSSIANSFKQDVGYLLDPDGQPRRYTIDWTVAQTYTIDLDDYRRRVAPLLA